MIKAINPNAVMCVGELYLKGKKTPLTNVEVFLSDRFIVVSRNDEEPPTWYNLDEVSRMYHVEAKKRQKASNVIFGANGEPHKITRLEESMSGNR